MLRIADKVVGSNSLPLVSKSQSEDNGCFFHNGTVFECDWLKCDDASTTWSTGHNGVDAAEGFVDFPGGDSVESFGNGAQCDALKHCGHTCHDLGDGGVIFDHNESFSEQCTPGSEHFRVISVISFLYMNMEDLPGALCLFKDVLCGYAFGRLVPHYFAQFRARDFVVSGFIANSEKHSFSASFFEMISAGMSCGHQPGEKIRFHMVATTTFLKVDRRKEFI